MKKIITFLCVLFLGASLFASGYIVESFVGKVTYNNVQVEAGQELDDEEGILNTSLNSSVVLTFEGKTYTIKPKQKGTVKSLFALAAPTKGGLHKVQIAKSDAEDNADGKRKGVSTASSRASEAKEDLQWDE